MAKHIHVHLGLPHRYLPKKTRDAFFLKGNADELSLHLFKGDYSDREARAHLRAYDPATVEEAIRKAKELRIRKKTGDKKTRDAGATVGDVGISGSERGLLLSILLKYSSRSGVPTPSGNNLDQFSLSYAKAAMSKVDSSKLSEAGRGTWMKLSNKIG